MAGTAGKRLFCFGYGFSASALGALLERSPTLPDRSGANETHLPLSPSPLKGGGGTQAAPIESPSPPLGAERAGERWGTLGLPGMPMREHETTGDDSIGSDRASGPAGWSLAGTCRTPDGCRALADAGVDAVPFSREAPLADAAGCLAGATHILLSIPPDAEGDPALDCHGADIAAVPAVEWIGYLSTTGVYGDTGGAWVDETATPTPTGERGRRRLAAENAWLAFGAQHGLAVHVFRLAGIYGPGRNALATARRGAAKRIDKPGHVFSRIHVSDIAQVLAASTARPRPGAIYNVCDDEPAPAADVVAHACALLGVAPPPLTPFEDADLSPMARSFYADNRRVSNARIKSELGVALRYPDYRAGLASLLAEEGGSA